MIEGLRAAAGPGSAARRAARSRVDPATNWQLRFDIVPSLWLVERRREK
jgi:hypothetical protein